MAGGASEDGSGAFGASAVVELVLLGGLLNEKGKGGAAVADAPCRDVPLEPPLPNETTPKGDGLGLVDWSADAAAGGVGVSLKGSELLPLDKLNEDGGARGARGAMSIGFGVVFVLVSRLPGLASVFVVDGAAGAGGGTAIVVGGAGAVYWENEEQVKMRQT